MQAQDIINLKEHQNCIIGSKAWSILLDWWILPIGGVVSRRVCNRLVQFLMIIQSQIVCVAEVFRCGEVDGLGKPERGQFLCGSFLAQILGYRLGNSGTSSGRTEGRITHYWQRCCLVHTKSQQKSKQDTKKLGQSFSTKLNS